MAAKIRDFVIRFAPNIMPPKISIVMPVWNGERYLQEAVDSILRQTFTDFELLAIDDGSTDATAAMLRAYADKDSRVRVHRLNHAGIVVALNHGLASAQGGWIARQDADDISLPHRLQTQWRAVQGKPGTVLCHSDVEFIGENAGKTGRARLPRSRSLVALRLCYQCPIVHTTVLFHKASALEAGGYLPDERHAEDFSLWGRLLERGDFIGLPERLMKFRLHSLSVSQQNLAVQRALARQIGMAHCRRFMQLGDADAGRANSLLLALPRDRRIRDWSWFLSHCAPRLRWKSGETLVWLAWQTLKVLLRR
jgi:glycosyltransferase involved in cell wall biosynthesis